MTWPLFELGFFWFVFGPPRDSSENQLAHASRSLRTPPTVASSPHPVGTPLGANALSTIDKREHGHAGHSTEIAKQCVCPLDLSQHLTSEVSVQQSPWHPTVNWPQHAGGSSPLPG